MKRIIVYDVTLRDGWQDPRKELKIGLKDRVYKVLEDFRPDYIEACWPSSSADDMEFIRKINWDPRVVAFGSTANPSNSLEDDNNLKDILASGASVATIYGKTWEPHVTKVLGISLEENLELIEKSVNFLRTAGLEVNYDAEHFFTGWKDNPGNAYETLRAALRGGASSSILCDTKGAAIPSDIRKVAEELKQEFPDISLIFGIHSHNDSGLATANTLEFADSMLEHYLQVQVQGTINGLGERCGNANLCEIIPDLELKYNYDTGIDLSKIKMISKRVADITGIPVPENSAFTGNLAFANKGGAHTDAQEKGATYYHIDPHIVGNSPKVLSGIQSGKANIMLWLKEFGYVDVSKKDSRVGHLLKRLKAMSEQGYDINGNMAERMLLVDKYFSDDFGEYLFIKHFDTSEIRNYKGNHNPSARTIIDGDLYYKGDVFPFLEIAESKHGPVDSQKLALLKILGSYYPETKDLILVDYLPKISKEIGSESFMRVPIKLTDGEEVWETIGLSDSILEASFEALHKGFTYKLIKDKYRKV